MSQIEKVLYTAKAHTTGGRDGASRTSDGRLDVKLSTPGTAGNGTNPEQLFAAGWSACFMSAMQLAAGKMKVDRKSTRLNSSHANISYAVFCLKKKNNHLPRGHREREYRDTLRH